MRNDVRDLTYRDPVHDDAQSEMVNHPAHYNANPSGVEAITVIEWMTFNTGTAMKYLWRAGHKGDPVEDLRKAAWYIDREIGRLTVGPSRDAPR
jgi:hypothetical protein